MGEEWGSMRGGGDSVWGGAVLYLCVVIITFVGRQYSKECVLKPL